MKRDKWRRETQLWRVRESERETERLGGERERESSVRDVGEIERERGERERERYIYIHTKHWRKRKRQTKRDGERE